MLQRKSAFSLIEIVIVLLILGILMVSFKQMFQPKNQDLVYSQNCINMLYGEIQNFANASMTSKGLYTGGETYFPEQYIITQDPKTNSIALQYSSGQNAITRKNFQLSGGVPNNFYCNNKNGSQTVMSGHEITITTNKWFQQTNNENPFNIQISGHNQLTGEIEFFLCNPEQTQCKSSGKISYDNRSKSIEKALCLSYTGTENSTCYEREK